MRESDRKCKLQCNGVGKYSVSLFDPPISPKSHGRPTTKNTYNGHFVKECGISPSTTEEENERI